MKTSCFKVYTGPGRISIARYAPRGTPAGFRMFKQLAPTAVMLKQGYDRDAYFRDILGPLDPQQTFDTLTGLAAGAEPVLLCWEVPPFTAKNWCHRRLVAEWFGDKLGISVPELAPQSIAPAVEPAPVPDVSIYVGRSCADHSTGYQVDAVDPDNPGQALVRRLVDGKVFSVGEDVLRARFPA